jgi:pimeloyl-ACP methyl ester carboxylesterase
MARLLARSPLLLLLLAACDPGVVEDADPTTGLQAQSEPQVDPGNYVGVSSTTVCFGIPAGMIPVPGTVTGTLFRREGAVGAGDKVILVNHGGGATRSQFDGEGIINQIGSFARDLARGGYSVVVVDRLGYGASAYKPFPGAGFTLTTDVHVEVTRRVVGALRTGAYGTSATTCAAATPSTAAGFRKVVLLGSSIGAGESEAYAGSNRDIDALIAMNWSNQGLPARIQQQLFGFVVPQVIQGKDYVDFMAGSQDCKDLLFYLPGADPAAVDSICTRLPFVPMPSGEAASIPNLIGRNFATIPNIAAPVLLIFGSNDAFVTGPDNTTGDPDLRNPEIGFFSAVVRDVTSFVVPQTGHLPMYHRSREATTTRILSWLGSKGL